MARVRKETPEERVEQRRKELACFFYKPYPWQRRLLEVIPRKNTVAAISSNKIGKCLEYQTLIDTPEGQVSIGKLFDNGKPFEVYAWDGEKKVVAKATAPFKKDGLHDCYRITMSDGRQIGAADHHRILTRSGWVFVDAFVSSLEGSYNYPPVCIDGTEVMEAEFIGSQEVYDFTVPVYNNYIAGGLVHHNTCIVANIGISWCLGYEPWNLCDADYPGAVKAAEGQYYRPSSLGISPPVNIVVTGEDWKLHIGKTLVPEFIKWAPKGLYATRKNEQGVEYQWEWHNGSTITFMSYSQEDDLFESFRIQGAIMDEPPPQKKFKGMSRGLLLDQGKTLMSLTPLKEAWILDEIVLSGRKDIGVVDGLTILDNPDLYNSDLAVLGEMGLDDIRKREFFDLLMYADKEKGRPVEDKGSASIKYLESVMTVDKTNDLKILKFIQDIDPADVPPRVFGQFKSLVGRVLKEFDESVHVIEPFDVPTNWPVVAMIDFHLSKPQAISYWTVDRQDVHYGVGEVWKNLNPHEVADDIIRRVKGGWNIEEAFIDPLSKGDTAYMRNRVGTDIESTYTILENLLAEHGITLYVASKDKESGIKNIQTRLKGPNRMPTVFLFNTCERHLYEIKRWVYDDEGKPSKDVEDHFCENFYRFTLTGTKFEDKTIKPLPKKVHAPGAWLGA